MVLEGNLELTVGANKVMQKGDVAIVPSNVFIAARWLKSLHRAGRLASIRKDYIANPDIHLHVILII